MHISAGFSELPWSPWSPASSPSGYIWKFNPSRISCSSTWEGWLNADFPCRIWGWNFFVSKIDIWDIKLQAESGPTDLTDETKSGWVVLWSPEKTWKESSVHLKFQESGISVLHGVGLTSTLSKRQKYEILSGNNIFQRWQWCYIVANGNAFST